MAINNVSFHSKTPASSDAVLSVVQESDQLKQQLMNKQQRLNHLSSDSEMNAKEKAKRRQEIEKQIQELNRKLELQRIKEETRLKEAKAEQAKEDSLKEALSEEISPNESSKEDSSKDAKEKADEAASMAKQMQEMISTEILLQQMRMKEQISLQKEQTQQVLEAEIKSDTLYGNDTTAKEEALSKLQRMDDFIIQEKLKEESNPFGIHSDAKIIIRE